MIYAVDFDGTLCKNAWPGIGKPNLKLIEFLKSKRNNGDMVILWTMREGLFLDAAVIWSKEHGLEYDAVNDNLQVMKEKYFNNPRKVYADIYIDDHNAICDIGIQLNGYSTFEVDESGNPVKYGRGRRPKSSRRGSVNG